MMLTNLAGDPQPSGSFATTLRSSMPKSIVGIAIANEECKPEIFGGFLKAKATGLSPSPEV